MILTKTEKVKVFKFQRDGEEIYVAASDKNWAKYHLKKKSRKYLNYKITEVREPTLKKSIGYDEYYQRTTAYKSLIRDYKIRSLPFVFWSNVEMED